MEKSPLFLALVIFLLCSSSSAFADEYDDLLVKQSKEFLVTDYDLVQPTTPEELIKNWKQIKGINTLTFLLKKDRSLFLRTNAAPHMLHRWAGIRIPYGMSNHEDPIVSVLAGMMQTYKYFLRLRLDDGGSRPYQGDVYAEVKDMVKYSGGQLAILVDKKYTNGKLLPPEKDVVEFGK